MKTKHALSGLISGLLLLAAGTTTAHAATIYADSFSRTGNLGGSAPDVTNVPGQTWIAPLSTTTGSLALDRAYTNAFLPVTIVSGAIYTLSADLDTFATDGNWLALGFSPTANAGSTNVDEWHTSNAVSPWILERGDPTIADQVYAGPGATNGQDVTANGTSGSHNYAVILDTTALNWTATWYRDSQQVGSTFTYSTNPTINYVGFGNIAQGFGNTPAGSVDNFTLSSVPEPGTAALCGMALVGIAAVRRRRATAV